MKSWARVGFAVFLIIKWCKRWPIFVFLQTNLKGLLAKCKLITSDLKYCLLGKGVSTK